MEEFLPLLSTDLIVFIVRKCIKRMLREVVCVCVCPRVSTPELLY